MLLGKKLTGQKLDYRGCIVLMDIAIIEQVQDVMDQYSIPIEVWLPIMAHESGGNPYAHNPHGEDSRGLFQINLGQMGSALNLERSARYGSYDLFDPVTNAEIAARDFMEPVYREGVRRGLSGADLTSYTWQYGIRPFWTDEKDQSIRSATDSFITTGTYNGQVIALGDLPGGGGPSPDNGVFGETNLVQGDSTRYSWGSNVIYKIKDILGLVNHPGGDSLDSEIAARERVEEKHIDIYDEPVNPTFSEGTEDRISFRDRDDIDILGLLNKAAFIFVGLLLVLCGLFMLTKLPAAAVVVKKEVESKNDDK